LDFCAWTLKAITEVGPWPLTGLLVETVTQSPNSHSSLSQNPNDEDYLLYTNQKWSDASYFTSTGKKIRKRETEHCSPHVKAAARACKNKHLCWVYRSMRDAPKKISASGTLEKGRRLNILEWYELDYEFTLTAENMSPWKLAA
jgi:hypothetical protein